MLLVQNTVINRPFYLGTAALTPVVALSKNGAAFGAAAGAVTEISNGWYSIALTAVDTNTLGALAWRITGAGVPTFVGLPVDQVLSALPSFGVAC